MHPPSLSATSPVADTGSPPLPEPIREVHILDRLVTVFRHLKLVVAVFSVVVAVGVLQSYSTVARYRAKASVLIQDQRSISTTNLTAGNQANYYEDPEPYFNTQFQILHGRALGQRVVQKLDLVNRGLPQAPAGGVLGSLRAARVRLSSAIRGGATAAEQPAPDADSTTAAENAVIGGFLSGVQVVPIRGTRLVEVTYDSTDPQFAMTAVNTLVEEYIQQNLDLRLRDVDSTLDWLSQQLGKQQEKV